MATPYLGQIKVVAFNFAPRNYALCNGQVLAINQNTALFSLLGTTYGGNGVTTFALPNLQSRAPIHAGFLTGGSNYTLGQTGGEEAHALNLAEMPVHTHELPGLGAPATAGGPGVDAKFANAAINPYRTSSAASVPMKAAAVASTGGSQPHENRQPYLAINFIIALQGVFPSRN
jgi:microcystin-dependent protein